MLDDLKRRNKQHLSNEVNTLGLWEWCASRAKQKVAHLNGASYQGAVLACLQSEYKDQTRRRYFPTTFDAQVTQKLSAKRVGRGVNIERSISMSQGFPSREEAAHHGRVHIVPQIYISKHYCFPPPPTLPSLFLKTSSSNTLLKSIAKRILGNPPSPRAE